MRLLRLTNSNDYNDEIPELLRGEAITRRLVAEAIGEDVETVSRAFWHGPKLPAKVSGWLDEYEPDMGFIRCAAYWVSFESLPLRIDRTLGRLGRWPAAVGKRLGSEPTVASNRAAVWVRRRLVRAIGGDTYFTPGEATRHVEAVLRVILAKESTIAVVRGPGHAHNTAGTARGQRRALARNGEFDEQLAALCARLRVAYVSARPAAAVAESLGRDDVHSTAAGQRAFAELESPVIAKAWEDARRV